MKTSSIFKTSLVALVASSALLAGQLYAVDDTDTTAKTEQMDRNGDRQQGSRGGMHNMHKMLRKLDLTDAQKEQVKVIAEKYKADRPERPTKEQREAHRAEMLALVTSASFDEAKATEMAEAQHQKRLQGMLSQLKMQNEIYQVLTPEQQQVFQEEFAKGKGKGHKSRR
ncbi:Spy/CpxP family protein refolding chaperone [Shewanella phaeophyticola]|uniref:Spy/CpxP family protein refolding chaperone n=1 Tax=Shewanella phaeophyticola TaxID=2978345 RepID=A0ABT2P7S8_9GAMM|nr:Spy/CpxP family protein refolding chaperone [Shewanella sp. KJ10-1]MCT8988552.1 Spy/CpxP family protein refolding chaperone [Shewanella sp. KJ10-1]